MIDFNVAITAVKNNNGFRPNDYDDSFYRPYILTGKKIIQARISGHGTHLWSWVKNSEYNPKDCMGNICVVFSPNGAFQCSTFVKASKYRNAKTNPSGRPYDFTVIQYVYDCSRITQYDLDLINKSIKDIPISGKYEDPLKDEVKKHAGIYELHPNQGIKTLVKPYVKDESIPSKIDRFEGDDYYTMLRHYREWNGQMYESKNYKNMKKNVQRINESQLRAIVAESVKKVLKESHSMEIEAALQDICRASSLIRNKTEYTQEEDYEPDYEIGYNDAAYLHKWASEIEEQAGEWLRN